MSNNIINISLQSKTNPTVNITIEDAGSVSGEGTSIGEVKFVATGPTGPSGARGETGGATIEDGSITSVKIANGAVGNPELAANSIYGDKILDGSIDGAKLTDNSITSSKIINNSITSDKILDGSITRALLSVDLITGNEIEDGSIYANQIANNNVVRELIQNNAVGTNEIEDDVTLNGTVTVTNLDLSGSSPATITGPSSDALEIKSNATIDFKNTSNTTICSLDQNGNLTVSGTIDGIDIATDVAANTSKTGITAQQSSEITANTAKNSYPVADQTKLAGIEVGAEANTQSNWNETNSSSDSFIVNKPTIPVDLTVDGSGTVHANNYTNTTYSEATSSAEGLMSTAHHDKLDGIATGATANVGDVTLTTTQTISGNKILNNLRIEDEEDDGTPGIRFYEASNNGSSYITLSGAEELDGSYEVVIPNANGDLALTSDINATRVTAAGALMDSEVTNLAQVKAFSSSDYATAAQGIKADSAQQPPTEGAFVDGDKTKLNGIAVGAEVNVQSDWNSSSGDSQILNKPTIPVDLTTSGTGTIDASNVPTLNQDTTGNAATATNLTGGNKALNGTLTSEGFIVDGNVSVTPGDGAAIHVDTADITDNATSASGTAFMYNHVAIENPRVIATNSNVTTTNASTLYIKGAPAVGANMTFTNAYAIYISGGASYFNGDVTVNGDVTGNVIGNVTGNTSGSSGSCTGNAATATNLVASTSTAVQLGTIELGHASDTTIARTAAGTVTIEGNTIATTNSLIDTKTAAYWSSSTSGFYITLSGASTSENTSLSTASYTLMYVAPFDGKIKRISSFHQNAASGTSTFEIYIDGDDSDLTNDQRGSDMTTSSFTRKFTEDCPADWTFSKGEAIAIKRTDSVARYGATMTIVFEYDTTT